MTKTIEIRDVGPVERLSIPIPEGGGVVVLRGRNGNGKSHSLQAVQALLGGKAKPVSRDDTLGASVEGLGARLTVSRRSSRSGEIEVETLEGEDPSLLVSPPVKDPAAADGHRIKALLRLSRRALEVGNFAELVGGVDRLRELCRPASLDAREDAPAMVAAIKRDLEGAARKEEAASENAFAKADGVRSALEGFSAECDFKCPSHEAAREVHTTAVRDHAALEALREQNGKLLTASREAETALSMMGDTGMGDADEAWSAAAEHGIRLADLGEDGEQGHLRAARDRALARGYDVDRLRMALEQGIGELQDAKDEVRKHESAASERSRLETRGEDLKRESDAIAQRAALQRAVDAASGASEITPAELGAASQKLKEASGEVEAWVLHDKTRSMREEVEEHDSRGKAAAAEGDALRRAAQGTEAVMMAAVRDVCGDDMKIQDGRIYVSTDRGQELFCELSPGERWRRALGIAVNAVGHKGLLVIPQESYEAMDPLNRMEVAAHARSLGVVILTAECDEGEIRAEVEPEVPCA